MLTRLIIAALLAGIGTARAEEPAGDADRGHKLFVADGCYQCHGFVGQGGPGLRLAPNPKPPVAIAAYIRNPTGEMPPYTAAVISDQGIRDVYAYLQTIPAPPKADGISLLKTIE